MRKNMIIFIAVLLIVIFIIFQLIIIPKYFISDGNYNLKNLERKYLEKGNGIVTNIWLENSRLDNLKNHNIKYLYVDIGETSDNGKIETPESEIIYFLDIIEEFEGNNNYEFVLLPYSEINTYDYDVNDEFVTNYIESYIRMIELGFDGIYIDIEPVRDKEYFLSLVKRVDDMLSSDSIIGLYSGAVSTSKISENEWEWEISFFDKVSENVDLILVPSYDTDFVDEERYNSFVKNQVRLLSQGNKIRSNLVYGIPVHKEGVETIGNSFGSYVSEVKKYQDNKFIGIGIFSEWTMDEEEWGVYEEILGR